MNAITFWLVYFGMQNLVVAQAIAAYNDGRLTRVQQKAKGITGHTLFSHGGWWYDGIFLSWLVAHIVSKYDWSRVNEWLVAVVFAGIAIGILCAGRSYSKTARAFGEAHTHHGKTTVAGWLHGAYALPAAWVLISFFFLPMNPAVSRTDLIIASATLTPFFFIGSVKFNRDWRFDKIACWQTCVGTALLWTVTCVRLRYV